MRSQITGPDSGSKLYRVQANLCMNKAGLIRALLVELLSIGLVGCGDLSPGNTRNQGAVSGGLGGTSAGFASGQNMSGAPAGGFLEPGASYVIGTGDGEATNGEGGADTPGRQFSVLVRKALSAPTADLNGDGFVTLDEVLAMKQAGLADDDILERLRATNQVFAPTIAQRDFLRNHGISNYVLEQMLNINGGQRSRVLNAPGGGRREPPGSIISVPSPEPFPLPAPPRGSIMHFYAGNK